MLKGTLLKKNKRRMWFLFSNSYERDFYIINSKVIQILVFDYWFKLKKNIYIYTYRYI